MSLDDNFCRRCGAAVDIIDVPALRSEARSLSVWESAKPAVTQGVMLIAAGTVLRLLLGRTGRAMISRALFQGDSGGDSTGLRRLVPAGGDRTVRRNGEELEILWYRRVRR